VQTLSVNGTLTQLYFWDLKSGDIRCVTDPGQTASLCDGDGNAQPGLRDWYKFDPLDRLKVFKSYRTNDTIDSSYVYDAFDRVSTETESHNGGGARTSDFGYLDISGDVSSETQRGSSASKAFTYDAYDVRIGATITTSGTQDYSLARNPHGDESMLVDDSGGLKASYAYKPYGNLDLSLSRGDVDPTDTYNPFRFNDRRFDTGSRTIDMGTRRYEPDDGRFVEQDFMRDASSDIELSTDPANENRYAFAGGNPITFVETDGHRVVADGGGVSRRKDCAVPPYNPDKPYCSVPVHRASLLRRLLPADDPSRMPRQVPNVRSAPRHMSGTRLDVVQGHPQMGGEPLSAALRKEASHGDREEGMSRRQARDALGVSRALVIAGEG
jgi:RHS repeat-associated protein